MLEYVLSTIICEEYQNKVNEWRKTGERTETALSIRFSVSPRTPLTIAPEGSDWDDCRYPAIEMLIYGPTNYIGVYLREHLMHPEKTSRWFAMSYHDSCWREDGVRSIIWEFRDVLDGMRNKSLRYWYDKIEVTSELEKELRTARDRRYEGSGGAYPFLVKDMKRREDG